MSRKGDDFDIRHPRYRTKVEVECECGHCFEVAESLKGGLANCPMCQRLTPVRGGPEPLFWLALGCGVFIAVVLSGIIAWLAGALAGGVTLAVCALLILIIVLAS